ncbi:MAG TPA: MBL fold metallo-hydrolase [Alphaproteobacteria bacterium]|jgi:glyoxylase-like metal-dependent hydrolase (beta-lactamase superfamily II)
MKPLSVGSFRVDRVLENEGPYFALDFLLPDAPPGLIAENADWLKPHFVDPADDRLILSFQSFVLRTGRHTILIDTCAGNDKERPQRPHWHRQKGPYLDRMRALGVAPEAIDFVFCTHLHADHVGWNTKLENGRWVPTFPNARYIFAKREYEHWEKVHREIVATGGEPLSHGSFADSVLPVVEAKRAVFVASDHEIETGVHLEAAYGHTPGNCVLHAKNRGGHALFIGDVMHTAAQLADPAISSRFCSDPAEAARTRTSLIERHADTDTIVLACHFPTPVAGRIRRHRSGFALAV